VKLEPPIPVLRIFDAALAKRFHIDWPGFTVDWEHRCGPDFPLYMQISRGTVILHLTEQSERPNPSMRPEVEVAPWNAKVMDVIDRAVPRAGPARPGGRPGRAVRGATDRSIGAARRGAAPRHGAGTGRGLLRDRARGHARPAPGPSAR
jgi:hypothetical protein